MYFVEFPVSTTNIFPLANSEAGGQLMSEYNIRSRETVATDPSVTYPIGPSYTHSMDDFKIWGLAEGAPVGGSVIQILPGRAIVNGHYVESLSEINIDLTAVNYKATSEGVTALKGGLAIGLVMMYSTYNTLAASALPENSDGYYEGVRVVIVPTQDMKRPVDVPNDPDKVNMHLLLGTFNYLNGQVSSVVVSEDKIKIFDASRVGDLSSSLSDEYITRVGLDPQKLYVLAGKGSDHDGVKNNPWCEAEDSLMIWDSHPVLSSLVEPEANEAYFRYFSLTDETQLVLPHKQIDGAKDQEGRNIYFPDKIYNLPAATFGGRGGVVTKAFTDRLLQTENKLNTFYRLPNGKMRKYISDLEDRSKLPKIPFPANATSASDYGDVIQNLSDTITSVYTNVGTVKSNLGTLRTSLSGVSSTLSESVLSLLSQAKTKLDSAKTTLVGRDNSAVSKLSNVISIVSDSRTLVSTDVGRLTGLLDSNITNISKAVDNVSPKGAKQIVSDNINIVQSALSHLDDQSAVSSELHEVNNSLSDLNAHQLTTIATEIGTVRTVVDQVNSDLSNIGSTLNSLVNPQGNGLLSEISNMVTDAGNNDISAAIGNINSAITSIQSVVTTLNQMYKNNDSTIPTAISNLDTQINALKSAKRTVDSLQVTIYAEIITAINTALDQSRVLTQSYWEPGDYVLVGQDLTMGLDTGGSYPATMYVVNLGRVVAIQQIGDALESDWITLGTDTTDAEREIVFRTVPEMLAGGVELASVDDIEYASQVSESLWDLSNNYRGNINQDYFVARMRVYDYNESGAPIKEKWYQWFFTPSAIDTNYDYIDPPIIVTGRVPYATTELVGGFLNIDSTNNANYGKGYVYRDEDGNLRIMDYEFLLLGIQATQLGQDRIEGSGLGLADIQSNLDEFVNDRICYPNDNQIESAEKDGVDPHIIHLTLTLPNDLEGGEISIHDIGSRYNSYLYVHIRGSATANTTVVFQNCEKLRIDSSIEGSPNIVLRNVNLYYDAEVLDRTYTYTYTTVVNNEPIVHTLPTGIENLNLWYERIQTTDPDLQVNGMTVTLIGDIESVESWDPWKEHTSIDSHFYYALRSITFASDGSIINVGMIVGDSTTIVGTSPDDVGTSLFRASFSLPQNTGLQYPVSKMTHKIKVTGTFVSCYYNDHEHAYMVKQTDFSALTQKYSTDFNANVSTGSIAFCTNAQYVDHITGVAETETVDVWGLNTPHIFEGGAIE